MIKRPRQDAIDSPAKRESCNLNSVQPASLMGGESMGAKAPLTEGIHQYSYYLS
jgi:hypothetical protein